MIYSVVITSYPHTPYKKRKNHRRTPNYENRKPNLSLTKLIFYDGMRKLAILSSPIYTSVSYFNVLFSGIISYSWLFHTESRIKTLEKWKKTGKLNITGAGNPSPLGIYTRSLFLFYHTVTRFFYVSVIM